MKKWPETIKTKKRTIQYGEQVLSDGHRLRWKSVTKHRRIHYGKFDYYVTYLCGKKIYHENANFSDVPQHITCPHCIDLLKEQGELP